MLVAQSFGKGLGFLQVDEKPSELAQGPERMTQCKAEIDGLRVCVVAVGEVLYGPSCLLKGSHRLPMGGARQRLLPSLSEIGGGLLPTLATLRMVGQQFRLRHHRLGKLGLQHLENALMGLPAHAPEY
jgi:hypothetical protein